MRDFRRFFLESSPEAAGLVLFFAALVGSDLAGALEAVEAGAFPAVEAGLGAIAMKKGVEGGRLERVRADGCESERDGGGQTENARGIYTDALVLFGQTRQRAEPYFVERHQHPHVILCDRRAL